MKKQNHTEPFCKNCGHIESICKLGDCKEFEPSGSPQGEFNLSEKVEEFKTSNAWGAYTREVLGLRIDYVKEFIKRRNDVIQAFLRKEINTAKMWIELNNLAGEDLK